MIENQKLLVLTVNLAFKIFHLSCQNLQPAQIAGFIRISQIKTPSPVPETGSYDPSICSPFWLKVEANNFTVLQQWHNLIEKSSR
jgi:hypothetical protein